MRLKSNFKMMVAAMLCLLLGGCATGLVNLTEKSYRYAGPGQTTEMEQAKARYECERDATATDIVIMSARYRMAKRCMESKGYFEVKN
jgi:uncharacterized protein YceK